MNKTISRPLVSAITIFLNAEAFIQESIESVLAQTYGHFELILVDDGSTDGSTQIAKGYAQQYPSQVRYVEHPNHENLGMSAARNLGLATSQGDYIAFLDADDIWLPTKLEKQIDILNRHPDVEMVFGPSKLWYSWTDDPKDIPRDWIETVAHKTRTVVEPPELLISSILRQQVNSASTCSLLVRRKTLVAVGGFEDRFRGLYEDQAALTKLYAQVPIYVMDECLDWYRRHPNSCVSMQSSQRQKDAARLDFLRWMDGYLRSQSITNPGIWSAFNDAIWPYLHPWQHRFQETIVPLGRKLLPVAFREWLWDKWSQGKQKTA